MGIRSEILSQQDLKILRREPAKEFVKTPRKSDCGKPGLPRAKFQREPAEFVIRLQPFCRDFA